MASRNELLVDVLSGASPMLARLGPLARLRLAAALRAGEGGKEVHYVVGDDITREIVEQDQAFFLLGTSRVELHVEVRAVDGCGDRCATHRSGHFIGGMLLGYKAFGEGHESGEVILAKILEPTRGVWIPGSVLRERIGASTLRLARALMALTLSANLRGLELGARAVLAEQLEPVMLRKGAVLFTPDSPADRVWVLGQTAAVLVTTEANPLCPPDAVRTYADPLDIVAQFGDLVGLSSLRPTFRPAATVLRDGEAWTITARAITGLSRKSGGAPAERALEQVALLHERTPVIVAALRTHPIFAGVPASLLALAGLDSALVLWRVGAEPPAPIGATGGMCVIATGCLTAFRVTPPLPELGYGIDTHAWLPAGSAIGLPEGSPVDDHFNMLTPREPTWMAFISKARIKRVMNFPPDEATELVAAGLLAHVRSGPYHCGGDKLGKSSVRPWPVRDGCEELILTSPIGNEVWTEREHIQIRALMLSLWSQFTERVLWVRAGATHPLTESNAFDEVGRPIVYDPEIPDELRADDALEDVARHLVAEAFAWAERRHHRRYSRVLLTVEGPGTEALRAHVMEFVHRVQYLSLDTRCPLPETVSGCVPVQYVAAIAPQGSGANAGARIPAGAARVCFDLNASTPEVAYAARAEAIDRWARALTRRRIGMALGGGGAWGMAHIAVLRALTDLNIPVDVISGASGGTIVGSYYSSGGIEKAESLTTTRKLIKAQAFGLIAMASMTAFVQFVRSDLGNARLEELTLPFIPVGTDLVTGSQLAVYEGALDFATRMSGGLVPVYATTPTQHATLVDGGFSRNVPSGLLPFEGARVVVACNIIPVAQTGRASPPRTSSTFSRIVSDLNPITRVTGLGGAALTLFNYAGSTTPELVAITFQGEVDGVFPFNFLASGEILRDFRSIPSFWSNVKAVERRWNRLRQPRVDTDVTHTG